MENRFDNIIVTCYSQIFWDNFVSDSIAFPSSGTTEEDFLNGEFHDCKANYEKFCAVKLV